MLSLNIPQSDGSLSPDSFHRASIADYNQIVAGLQGGAANQNGAAARSEQAAAQQKAYQDAVSSLSAAIDDLGHNLASLQGENPASTLQDYANDWASM